MFLAISTNSFHFKYYKTLHKIWGLDDPSERSGLCSYSQFIFWMSILTLLLSPFILLGWSLLKMSRFFYKVCSWSPWGRKFVDLIDELGFGNFIDTVSEKMVETPVSTLTKFCFVILLSAIFISALLTVIIFGIVFFKNVLITVIAILLLVSFAIFHVFFAIGFISLKIFLWIVTGLKIFGLFMCAYATFFVFLLLIVSVLLCLSFVAIKLIGSSKTLTDFFGFKINGYQKARQNNSKRREELKKIRQKNRMAYCIEKDILREKKEKGEIPYTLMEKTRIVIKKFLKYLGNKFISKTQTVKGGTFKVVSGLGLIWEMVKSIKHGICPIVEFIDENESPNEE